MCIFSTYSTSISIHTSQSQQYIYIIQNSDSWEVQVPTPLYKLDIKDTIKEILEKPPEVHWHSWQSVLPMSQVKLICIVHFTGFYMAKKT